MQTLLKGAKVYRDSAFEMCDILIEDGDIVYIEQPGGQHISDMCSDDCFIYDFSNKVILPGLIDVHVHLREPGFSYKEDVASGTQAAARGGYTDVCPMPNLKPVPDTAATLAEELEAIRQKAVIKVHPYGSITMGEQGDQLADLDAMAAEVVGFSDDGVGVVSDDLMRQAFTIAGAHGKMIAAHCEYKSLMGGAHVNAGPAAQALGIDGISNESEWRMIERDIKLAEELGAAYHVCHVSTAESVDLIRQAKARGVNVTCETGPHYLVFEDQDIVRTIAAYREYVAKDASAGENVGETGETRPACNMAAADSPAGGETGAAAGSTPEKVATVLTARDLAAPLDDQGLPVTFSRLKMNPPFRSSADRLALVAGLVDGTIDMIATDHAPHSAEEKGRGILGAPMGVVGLETALPVMYTYLVETGVISLEQLVKLMSTAPAKRFGLESGIEVGRKANLCVYDLEEEYVIDPETFTTRGRSTPFDGVRVKGRCLMTICDGSIVYSSQEKM